MRCLAKITFILCLLFSSLSASAADLSGKKVLFVDSYAPDYEWSKILTSTIRKVIEESGATFNEIHLDTKNNASPEFIGRAVERARRKIDSFDPDVVIASDDNASKYLIVPYYKGKDLPFVFCGVNWSAKEYGFPAKNVTGMLEVVPYLELIDLLKKTAGKTHVKIATLGPDLLSERKTVRLVKEILDLSFDQAVYVKTFDEWKEAFRSLQSEVDLLIMPNANGVKGFNEAEAIAFVEAETKIPTGSVFAWMKDYVALTYAASAEEHGRWSAKTALKILEGTSPGDIPLTRNAEGRIFLNDKLISKLGLDIPAYIQMLEEK